MMRRLRARVFAYLNAKLARGEKINDDPHWEAAEICHRDADVEQLRGVYTLRGGWTFTGRRQALRA